MTPQEKADSVIFGNKQKIMRYMREAEKMLEIPRKIDYRAGRLIEIIDDIGNLAAPVSTCKKGCDHCCYQAVAISTWEAERIAKFSKRKPTGFAGYDMENADGLHLLKDTFANSVCPFLADNLCTIYPVRPFVCRSHISLSDDPLDCSLSLKPGGKVPYLNLEEFRTAFAWMFTQDGIAFGDIREFFT